MCCASVCLGNAFLSPLNLHVSAFQVRMQSVQLRRRGALEEKQACSFCPEPQISCVAGATRSSSRALLHRGVWYCWWFAPLAEALPSYLRSTKPSFGEAIAVRCPDLQSLSMVHLGASGLVGLRLESSSHKEALSGSWLRWSGPVVTFIALQLNVIHKKNVCRALKSTHIDQRRGAQIMWCNWSGTSPRVKIVLVTGSTSEMASVAQSSRSKNTAEYKPRVEWQERR